VSAASDLFDGPVSVMLAKAQDTIPHPGPGGGLAYEPKWDGYRGCLQMHPDGTVRLWSRNGTDLSDVFPDLVEDARLQVPPGVILDGEIVALVDGRLSFDHLQHRMVSSPSAAARLARSHPASYVAFDIIAVGSQDVRALPWRDRRLLLDELADGFTPPLQVSPVTEDYATASEWFTTLTVMGVEGLVIKSVTSRYLPGERGWVKVKRRELTDGLIGAVIGPVTRPEALVVGRFATDGALMVVGRSTPLTAEQAKDLARVLTSIPASQHPWPTEIGGGHFGGGKVAITHVLPEIVVEVAADSALQAGKHRHAVRYVRRRPDLDPDDLQPTS
jgi:ATP-dependent DNA ligase